MEILAKLLLSGLFVPVLMVTCTMISERESFVLGSLVAITLVLAWAALLEGALM
jgi:hypothetical protein